MIKLRDLIKEEECHCGDSCCSVNESLYNVSQDMKDGKFDAEDHPQVLYIRIWCNKFKDITR